MPKITVYKDNNPRFAEHNIRLPGELLDMFSESQPSLVERRADTSFQPGVLTFDAGHAVAALLRSEVVHRLLCII